MKDPRSALPWLWVFMLVNYLYCDVLSLFDPAVLREVLGGTAAGGSIAMTPEMLFASAILMEIPMAMIVLSRVLRHDINRWANVLAAGFMAVVQVASNTVGTATAYYVFFSIVEVGTLVVIAVIASRWTAASPSTAATAA